MRDLVFRNLTSEDRRRRVIASSEITDKDGLRSIVHRHFACIIKEDKGGNAQEGKAASYLYVLKEHDSRSRREKFFCRMKSSIYTVYAGRRYLIFFMHSLKISLMPVPKAVVT